MPPKSPAFRPPAVKGSFQLHSDGLVTPVWWIFVGKQWVEKLEKSYEVEYVAGMIAVERFFLPCEVIIIGWWKKSCTSWYGDYPIF